jgi:hypothetical protein
VAPHRHGLLTDDLRPAPGASVIVRRFIAVFRENVAIEKPLEQGFHHHA